MKLATKIFLSTLGLLVFSVVVYLSYFWLEQNRLEELHFREASVRIADTLRDNLANELWNLNAGTVAKVSKSMMLYDDIVALDIQDNYQRIHESWAKPFDPELTPVVHDLPIFYENDVVGRLRLTFQNHLLKNFTSQASTQLYAFATGLLVLMALISIFIARGISRPIAEVVQGLRQVEEGDFNTRFDLGKSDEFYLIKKHFNSMNEGLKAEILARQRKEHELFAEHERLEVTLKSISDGVITTDLRGQIVLMNRAAAAMTGWTQTEGVGWPLTTVVNLVHEASRRPFTEDLAAIWEQGRLFDLSSPTLLVTKQGSDLSVAFSGAPIVDSAGTILGAVLVFRDMTERNHLVESQARAERLETIAILSGGIAHDFNNLLAGIFGYLELAQLSLQEAEYSKTARQIEMSLGIYERARALTQQLLTFARGGAPIRKTLFLPPFLTKSVQFLLSGSAVTSHFDFDPNLWTCDCDQNQIGQVIDNLVINAKQAMGPGGVILVRAENQLVGPQQDRYVHIFIRDNGPGIPKENLPHIFDPFFSTKRTGHGLGLATVHAIIKRHGGRVEVDSEAGRGTTFHVYLPASDKARPIEIVPTVVVPTGKGRVLVLDDEDFLREVTRQMLEAIGYRVSTFKTGQEAVDGFLQALQARSPFDICLLDLTIPGGQGGAIIMSALRALSPKVKIVATSGYLEDPIMNNPVEFGFDDRLGKPFQLSELKSLLSRLLG